MPRLSNATLAFRTIRAGTGPCLSEQVPQSCKASWLPAVVQEAARPFLTDDIELGEDCNVYRLLEKASHVDLGFNRTIGRRAEGRTDVDPGTGRQNQN